MSDAMSFAVLVCVAAMGLLHLAVHADAREHAIASSIVAAVALPIALVRPEAAVLLFLAAVGSRRLRNPAVPDRVPADWADH